MAEEPENPSVKKLKLLRCMDWLQKQNSLDTKKLQQNKNDIQFIIQTNADRKNFLLSVAEDEATVPDGVHEPSLEPKAVVCINAIFLSMFDAFRVMWICSRSTRSC